MRVNTIETERLELVALEPETIRHLIQRDRKKAEEAQGLSLPHEFPTQDELEGFLAVQLHRMEASPDRRDWLARLVVTRVEREVIGHCGFHGPPEVIGRAEIGYTVFAPFRSHGFAKEAARALVEWALSNGEAKVYASVSPDNAASLAVVRSVGFTQVGTQVDEVDGLELVFAIAQP